MVASRQNEVLFSLLISQQSFGANCRVLTGILAFRVELRILVRIDLSPWKVENAGLEVLVHDDFPLLANEKKWG